ncbi:MAG: amidohydrolase family protein [Candidatus Omnitrophica bacterium]|nr:amidohydrolase family protein [Candidatus Omnitrophota bacterium]
MKGIIDFHTHAFPDPLAEKAIELLEKEGGVPARLDGKVSSLLTSMDVCGIEKSVICSIATKPSQFDSILKWSESIASERLIPFPSIHPDDPEAIERIEIIKQKGFKGIKLHPYYQDFNINDKKMFPLYEKISEENLILVLHTGFDFAFERIRKADPEKIIEIKRRVPFIKLVTTHLGAWEDWDDVRRLLVGEEIYMEISYSLEFLDRDKARDIITNHPERYILFGTDSPWTDQKETLELFRVLELPSSLENKILRENALSLLSSVDIDKNCFLL